MKSANSIVIALCSGILGSLFGWCLMLPARFLMGPVLVSTLFAILRTNFSVPEQIKQISFILIGISVGSNVTPEALLGFSRWPLSILLMILSVVTIIFACKIILQNYFGMDKRSSLLASTPGHLSFVLMLGAETRADTTKIAIIQSIRVLVLTIITPVIVVLYSRHDLSKTNVLMEIINSGSLVVLCLLSIIIGFIGSTFGTGLGFILCYYMQETGIDISEALTNSVVIIPSVLKAKVSSNLLYLGYIPGLISIVFGTALAGRGIFKRNTSKLFKELEV